MSTLLLGIGNIIMGDDGIGPHVINRLRSDYVFAPEVALLDGGTLGLDLLHYLEGITSLIIVDACDMGKPPGHMQRFSNEKIPLAGAYLSAHQSGIPDLLALADLQGCLPQQIVLWGVQPESISLRLELSHPVAECMEALVLNLIAELDSRVLPATGAGKEKCNHRCRAGLQGS